MRMLLTADWQAEWGNLDLCEQAGKEVVQLLRRYELDEVWFLGDLKRAYNPVDMRVVKFWQRLIVRLRKYWGVHILLGNHDREGQTDDQQNWLEVLGRAGAQVYDMPAYAERADGSIFVLPWSTDVQFLKQTLRKAAREYVGKKNVVLFHQDVRGARYNLHGNGHRSEAQLTVADFHSCAYRGVFGGHVHLHQNVGERVWYVGSPFATDWGEANQRKGYVVLAGGASASDAGFRFVESKIPRWFDETWSDFSADHVTAGARVRIHVPCTLATDYGRTLERARIAAERNYPGAAVYVIPEFGDDRNGTGKQVIDKDAPDAVKIRDYVRQTVPDELAGEQRQIVQYLIGKLEEATGYSIRRQERIEFRKAKAKNFLSFKEVECDFKKTGITVITGRNRDWTGRSNGAGKTSYLQLLPVALFGRTFKGQQYDRWARRGSVGAATVDCWVSDAQGRKLHVQRQRRPVRLRFTVNQVDHSTGLRGDTRAASQGLIEKATGYSWQTLANAVYIDQSVTNAFLGGTRKERADVIAKFQNLERFEKGLVLVRQDLHENEEAAVGLETRVAAVRARRGEAWKHLERLREELQAHKKVVVGQLQRARRQYERVRAEYDRHHMERGIEKERVRRRLQKVERARDRLRQAVDRGRYELARMKDQISGYKQRIEQKVCPTCLQRVPVEPLRDSLRGIEKQARELERVSAETRQRCAVVVARYLSLRRDMEVLEKRDQEEYRQVTRQSTECAIAQAEAEDGKRMRRTKALVKQAQGEWEEYKRRVKKWKLKLQANRNRYAFLKYGEAAFSRDGIPQFLSQGLVPVLNREAERYAELFADKTVQVRFDATGGEFDVTTVNGTGGESIEDQSTGERAVAGLIASFALREIAPRCNVLILDEPGEGLDAGNARQFAQALKTLNRRIASIFVTTHNPAILGELAGERVIEISKRRGVSRVVE